MRTQRGIAATKTISHRGHRDHRDISKKQYKKRITSDKYRQNPIQKSLQNLKSLHVSSTEHTEKKTKFDLFILWALGVLCGENIFCILGETHESTGYRRWGPGAY